MDVRFERRRLKSQAKEAAKMTNQVRDEDDPALDNQAPRDENCFVDYW